MRALFLEVETEAEWAVASIGPAFLAAFVRRHGHEVEMLRVPLAMTPDEVIAEVRVRRPGLLALSLTTRQWLRGRDLIREVRRSIDVPVVAGGLHPTFSGEEVLASPGFDFVCLGEGEETFRELLDALEAGAATGGIANLWMRGGVRPAIRPPFEPMDALPFLARDLLDEPPGVAHMTTQRGCPYPCTYCAARNYDQLYKEIGTYGRRRSHASVLAELAELRDGRGLSYVIFLDDTFTLNRPWLEEFCRVYGEEFRVPFSLNARVETMDEDLVGRLAAAGCWHITYGVESGSERLRREVLRRPVANRRFADVFRWTCEAGILVTANYMLGLPGETPADAEETLALAAELPADDFGYFVFYPYPGTPLFTVCRDRGYLPDDYLERPANHRESILRLPDLSPADIADLYERFTALREQRFGERFGTAGATDHVRKYAATG
jgi:anaerobic magnesium-protoporphyrin IX monomethyl ester cyclase